MSWHNFITYSIYRLIQSCFRAIRREPAPKRCRHGVHGECAGCQAGVEEARRDEFARTPEGIRLAKQGELDPVYAEYSVIEEDLRESFGSKIEDRVRRFDLKYGPGELEAAVVRMYRAHLSRRTSR